MTGKSRKTHLLGYGTLPQLRLSTIPEITKQVRKNKCLARKLQDMVSSHTALAKSEIEDFYSEVTYKASWQKKSKKGKTKVAPLQTPPNNRCRKGESVDAAKDDSDNTEDVFGEDDDNSPTEDEEEEESQRSGDSDLFGDRFSSGEKGGKPATPATLTNHGGFKRSLQAMLDSAVGCGALNKAWRVYQRWCAQ